MKANHKSFGQICVDRRYQYNTPTSFPVLTCHGLLEDVLVHTILYSGSPSMVHYSAFPIRFATFFSVLLKDLVENIKFIY